MTTFLCHSFYLLFTPRIFFFPPWEKLLQYRWCRSTVFANDSISSLNIVICAGIDTFFTFHNSFLSLMSQRTLPWVYDCMFYIKTCVHVYIYIIHSYLNGLIYLLSLLWKQNMCIVSYSSKATIQFLDIFYSPFHEIYKNLLFSAWFKLTYD